MFRWISARRAEFCRGFSERELSVKNSASKDLYNREWLTTGQVASILGRTTKTVSKMLDSGVLEGYKVVLGASSHRKFSRVSLLAYMRQKNIAIPQELRDPDERVKYVVVFGDADSARAVSESLGEEFEFAVTSHIFGLVEAFKRPADAFLLEMQHEKAAEYLKFVKKRHEVRVIGFATVPPSSLEFDRGDFTDWFRFPFDDIHLVREVLNR
ncbi:MAG: Mycobacterial persistence regulator [Pseudomonadota bacterium]